MPVIIGAKRKLRADARKEIVNNKIKGKIKTALKTFKLKPSNETLKEVFSALDSASKKGIIPKNRADRKKSRIAIRLAKMPKASSKKPAKSRSSGKTSRTTG